MYPGTPLSTGRLLKCTKKKTPFKILWRDTGVVESAASSPLLRKPKGHSHTVSQSKNHGAERRSHVRKNEDILQKLWPAHDNFGIEESLMTTNYCPQRGGPSAKD